MLKGFVEPVPLIPRRVIIAVDGLEKQGKTHFAFTAPHPIAYFDFDTGSEGVREKFQAKGKRIYVPDPPFNISQDDTKDENAKEWTRFSDRYLDAIRSGEVRTVIIDTATEAWELKRLADHGKLTQVLPVHYTKTNAGYRDIIRAAFESTTTNLILLHKLKAEWREGKEGGKANKTGRFERAGFGETGFLVQANFLAYRVPANERTDQNGVVLEQGWRLLVKDCRQNPDMAGMEFQNDTISFPLIAAMMLADQGVSMDDFKDCNDVAEIKALAIR